MTQGELQAHLHAEHYKCGRCEIYFSRSYQREEHEHQEHFYCGYCDRRFSNDWFLQAVRHPSL